MTASIFTTMADKIEEALDRGRPGMGAIGGARLAQADLAISQARQLDALVTAMEGVVLVVRALGDVVLPATPPAAPVLADDRVERAARMIGYAVSPDTMGDSVDVWWSSVSAPDKERFRKLARNVLDGTVNET